MLFAGVPEMIHPLLWSPKLRIAVLTLATFVAMC